MTKKDLIEVTAKAVHTKQKNVALVLKSFMSTVKNALMNKEPVHLRGFGSFIVIKKAQKVARDIRRKKQLIIPSHYAPKLKVSKQFKAKLAQIT